MKDEKGKHVGNGLDLGFAGFGVRQRLLRCVSPFSAFSAWLKPCPSTNRFFGVADAMPPSKAARGQECPRHTCFAFLFVVCEIFQVFGDGFGHGLLVLAASSLFVDGVGPEHFSRVHVDELD